MISRELLRDVQGYKINIARIGSVDYNNHLLYEFEDGDQESINIHELAHRCKEWALEQGYILKSRIFDSNGGSSCQICKPVKDVEYIEAETETEAIFKACQWILDNKN